PVQSRTLEVSNGRFKGQNQVWTSFRARSNMLVASSSRTCSSRWLYMRHVQRKIPRSSRLDDTRTESTVISKRKVSPGRTGNIQRIRSTPGDPKDSEPVNTESTTMRIAKLQVSQPLPIKPPQRPCEARSGSV